jgi:hypothetical protein
MFSLKISLKAGYNMKQTIVISSPPCFGYCISIIRELTLCMVEVADVFICGNCAKAGSGSDM